MYNITPIGSRAEYVPILDYPISVDPHYEAGYIIKPSLHYYCRYRILRLASIY